MPIIDLELVVAYESADVVPRKRLEMLADLLGEIFNSQPTGTWIRLRYLPESRYAENQQSKPEFPVFVTVLKANLPDQETLAAEMRQVAKIVAEAVERPEENVHVLYEPSAAGRIGFGGTLRAR